MIELHPECGAIFVDAFARRKLDLTVFTHNTHQTVRLARSNWAYKNGVMVCRTDMIFDVDGVAETFEITEGGLCLMSGSLEQIDYEKGATLEIALSVEMFSVGESS